MRDRAWITAFLSLRKEGTLSDADLARQFVASVVRRGDRARLPMILRGLEAALVRDLRTRSVLVRSARALSDEEARRTATALFPDAAITPATPLVVTLDPTLSDGAVVSYHGHRVDQSAKRALRDLYTRLLTLTHAH